MIFTKSLSILPAIFAIASASGTCKKHDVDFIMIEGDADLISIEDNIREHLDVIGIKVTPRYLSKADFNAAHQSGDFHLSFTETWGSPYDPHAYASGWIAGDEGHNQAMTNLEAPVTRDSLFADIDDVLTESDHKTREAKWSDIHQKVHDQAFMLPLWGKRVPTIINNRLVGYVAGSQQFDYPVQHLKVISGPKTATIAPGAQSGLFNSVGRLDPHSYRPNEFFSNNWVYEGLVSYGAQGQTIPALAKNWTITDNTDGTQTYVFTMRGNVTFHDGSPWNCAAAKLNFDHVLAEPLRTSDYHGWYGLMSQVSSWICDSVTDDFVVNIKSKYYPFLQELSFIRPLRMLSPASFAPGDHTTANSCPSGWGTVTLGDISITCAGINGIYGTGPYVFKSRSTIEVDGEDVDEEVIFDHNKYYWGGVADIEQLRIVRYDSAEEVKNALLVEKSLDIVWGAGVLQANEIADLEDDEIHSGSFSVFHTDDIQNALLLLNTGKPPLDDINVRRALIHAVDKKSIIEEELGEDTRPVDNVFPLDAPYCDLDLTPRWDYDIQKADFLNCPEKNVVESVVNDSGDDSDDDEGLIIGLSVGFSVLTIGLAIGLYYYSNRSKKFEQDLEGLRMNQEATKV